MSHGPWFHLGLYVPWSRISHRTLSHCPECHMGLCPAVPSLGTMSHGPCFTWDYVPQSPSTWDYVPQSRVSHGTLSYSPVCHMGLCPAVPLHLGLCPMVPEFTWDYKCPMVPGLKWDSVLQLNKGSLNDHFPYLIIMVWSKKNCPKS